MKLACGGCLAALAALAPAAAADWGIGGFADLRAIAASDDRAWIDGGLGKLRYGSGADKAQLAQAGVRLWAQPLAELTVAGDLRYLDADHPMFELVDAYLRYRPASTTRWRGSVRAGAFFPNVSLENTAIGWTGAWTLTPSAINSWVGEELRTIGVEPRVEYRSDFGTFDLGAAAFLDNDPAGELMFARGWSLSDAVYGLGGRLREPDIYAQQSGYSTPRRFNVFQELDHRPGWHADLGWSSNTYGQIRLLRYDNEADASTHSDDSQTVYSWRTRFWSLGAETHVGRLTLIAQGMDGSTVIAPSPDFHATTDFRAAFLLAGLDLGEWKPAFRFDVFSTEQTPETEGYVEENGTAETLALNWQPRRWRWMRWTAEASRVEGSRSQREQAGQGEDFLDTQVLLNLRLQY